MRSNIARVHKKIRRAGWRRVVSSIAAIIAAFGFLTLTWALLWAMTVDIPSIDSFHNRKVAQSTKVYDRTGKVLLYDVHGAVRRTEIPFTEISPVVKNATVAIEDAEFYQHYGIKPTSIIRAVFANIQTGSFGQGGSTITQQVVKNALLTPEKTITRKIKEWILAVRLERMLSKEDILSIYLNETPYGGTLYGVEEASRYFFGKSARDVTLAEAAYLAALPQAPTYYSPYGNHRDALEARKNAGLAIDYTNEQYIAAGAKIVTSAKEIYGTAEMVLKVKEPQKEECKMIKKNQIVFSYLHLAAEPELTKMLIASKCVAIAFETVNAPDNSLPLLAPMSEVAGKLSIQAGAKALEKASGGRGVLLGGVPGVAPAKVAILGGGVSGTNAAKVAIGAGANVTILDKSLNRIRYLSDIFGSAANILYASLENIEKSVIEADLVIGAVLIPGASAPKLVTKKMVKKMQAGAVMVDISIDQGGCFETSKPTSHSNPTYVMEGVVHYCVTNMPGAVARTSTHALENATLPFSLEIANKGYRKALNDNKYLRNGLNVFDGKVTFKAVADSLGYKYVNAEELI